MTPPPRFERRRRSRGAAARLLGLFYDALRFLAGHVRGFYGAILTYLSFAFIVFLGALVGFGLFAAEVLEGETQAVDEAVLRWLEGVRSPTLDHVMLEITGLANAGTVIVVVLLSAVFLWETRHRLSVYLLGTAVAGGQIVNFLLKDAFSRPRPSVVAAATDVMTASFPSGHAMAATVAYGTVAYLVGRLERTRALRLTTWVVALVLIVLIGFSRMYLGVHYPTDIIAGFVAGLGWTAFVISGMAALEYFRPRHPEVEEVERDLEKGPVGKDEESAA